MVGTFITRHFSSCSFQRNNGGPSAGSTKLPEPCRVGTLKAPPTLYSQREKKNPTYLRTRRRENKIGEHTLYSQKEDFFKKIEFLPECNTLGFFFKKNRISSPSATLFPECCTQGRGFLKTADGTDGVKSSRVLGRHLGKTSPSVRFLALGKTSFP
jgi:hypothetical protein